VIARLQRRLGNDALSYQSRTLVNLPSKRHNLLYCLAFFLLTLSGCTTLPRTGPAEGGFHLRGKMGIVQGEESFSARFLWVQQGEQFSMDFWGPLGQGRVRLTGDDRRLELREGDGTLISEGTPDVVMVRHLGWTLPLAVLPQWVRGRPARGIPVQGQVRDDAGRLTGFRQLDWEVALERYRPVAKETEKQADAVAGASADGAILPYRVTARRDAYRVRLAITEWRI
jgi:outer membrane lipoprotein LolB